jgi:RND family efflux transporter MFP subunit
MNLTVSRLALAALMATAALVAPTLFPGNAWADQPAAAGAPKPALSVAVVSPQPQTWSRTLSATGSLAAWREVQVGTEASGQRIERVLVDVGQRVKKGELLAQLARPSLEAELAATRASLAEAEASAQETSATAARTLSLAGTDAVSASQLDQARASQAGALARVAALKARVQADELRLSHTRVVAPVDGVITQRDAVEGALPQPGQVLFHMIRDGRLEWRAEVPATELAQVSPGQRVRITPAGAAAIDGRVRLVAPTVDPATRNGRVMVDVQANGQARAGMFARGEIVLGEAPVLTLPQSAVLLRDGFAYVFKVEVDGKDNKSTKVRQIKVQLGERQADRVAVRSGVVAVDRVVTQGVGFLADGDTVRVVPATPAAATTAAR